MRQTVSTVSTTRSASSENHLDALLDDLQSTISRTGSLRGVNGSVSGYREVRRTVRDDATGENSTEYSIEYLHPANSTTHVRELSPSSPDGGYSTGLSSVREVSKYNTASSTLSSRKSDQQRAVSNSHGFDSGILNTGSALEERHSIEERQEYRGPRRELVFTGPKSREPSPTSALAFPSSPGYNRPVRQEVYRYEKTTTSKTIAPDGTVIYHDGDGGGKKSFEEVRTVRSPSPQYLQYRDPSPGRLIDSSSGYGKTNQSYIFSSSHESQKSTRTPPPHRSPSPVSFSPPPNPPTPPVTVRSTRHTTTSSYDNNYHTSVPQPKFTPIDTNYRGTVVTTTTTTNKYSDGKPQPFPNPGSPLAGDQQPPKRLDDLMATFDSQDSREYTKRTETTESRKTMSSDSGSHVVHIPIEKKGPIEEQKISKQKVETREETKNISGPPVYYPKGELFTKKEESQTHSQSASGGGKYKAKRNYKYESGSKYKESSDTKVVPVCVPCPCCCAAPCSIM